MIMKKLRRVVILLTLFILIYGINTYADTLAKRIDVLFNSINIKVNDKNILADNILYDETTFIPIRAAAEMLGMEVEWFSETRTAKITSKKDDKNADNREGLYVVSISPKEDSEDVYLKWGYLHVLFNDPMQGSKNIKDIYLIDAYGEKNEIEKVEIGIDSKETICIIPKNTLKLNTYYNLYIPEGNLISASGIPYDEDILLHFKTANNVIKGRINSKKDYYTLRLVLSNNTNEYHTMITKDNEFFFTNIEEGQYIISVKNEGGINEFEYNVNIEANKINDDIIIYDNIK